MFNSLKDFGKGYPKSPYVEVEVEGRVSLMHEIEVRGLRFLSEFERRRHLERLLEAKKRSKDVVTMDDRYLTLYEYRKEKENEQQ